MVQWLRLCTSIAGGTGSIPGQGTKIPYAVQRSQKKPKRPGTIRLRLTVRGCGLLQRPAASMTATLGHLPSPGKCTVQVP